MHFVSLRLGGDLVFLEAFGAPNFYITCNKLEVIRDRSPSFLRKKNGIPETSQHSQVEPEDYHVPATGVRGLRLGTQSLSAIVLQSNNAQKRKTNKTNT